MESKNFPRVYVDETRCIGCGQCERVCVAHVFSVQSSSPAVAQTAGLERCIQCGHCVAVCPCDAVTLNGRPSESLPHIVNAPLDDVQRAMLFSARRSIRCFKPEPPAPEQLQAAIELARFAPTAGNKRGVQWSVINTRSILQELGIHVAEVLEKKEAYAPVAQAQRAGKDPIMRGAPCLVLAHTAAAWGAADCAAAVSYLELILHSMNLGSCWSGYVIMAAQTASLPLLKLPQGNVVYAGLLIGTPDITYARVPYRDPAPIQWID